MTNRIQEIGLTGDGNPLHPCRAPYTTAPLLFVSRDEHFPTPEAAA
jgi:hypothetical protein